MSLTNILKEIASPRIYHFTRYANLIGILKNNTFNTTNTLGTKTDREHNAGKFYFFSTQRSGHGELGYAKFKSQVRIVLDGRKLNQNFKAKPVDYWGAPRDPKDAVNRHQMLRNNEMEDRFMLDEPEIRNASKYIERVDVYLDDMEGQDQQLQTYVQLIDKYAKKRNVDVYYFTEDQKTDWNNMRTNRATTDISELGALGFDEDWAERVLTNSGSMLYSVDDLLLYMRVIDPDFYEKAFGVLIKDKNLQQKFDALKSDERVKETTLEDYQQNAIEDRLSDFTYRLAWAQGENNYRKKELITTLESAIHNNRNTRNKTMMEIMRIFIRMMKKYGLRSVEDVVSLAVENAVKEYN